MLKQILFPHPEIRKIQDQMINDLLTSLEKKQHFLMHAPTGIGKTSILAPLLSKTLNTNKTIFFLTSKHTQHKIAINTLKLIKQKYKTKFLAVDFIGKQHMCPIKDISSLTTSQFYEYCKDIKEKDECSNYLKSKTKSIEKNLLLENLTKLNPLDVEELCKLSKDFCPFEISCILARKAKIIIADYHYILSPTIRKIIFERANKSLENSIIIFDEAHNLPRRARELLTSTLSTITIERAIKEAKKFYFATTELENIQKNLLSLSKKTPINKQETLIEKSEFIYPNEVILSLQKASESILEEKKKSYLLSIASFLEAWKGPDHGFARILTKGISYKGKPYIQLSYHCLDPSLLLKPIIQDSHFITCMSGTLSPIDFYQDILGFDNSKTKEYPSPFPKENRLSMIIPITTTKFTQRNEQMFQKISDIITSLTNQIPGNILIFFPSYQIKDQVFKFIQFKTKKTIFQEIPDLTKQQKEEILERFKTYKKIGAILLAVSSGSFGEGIDLLGDLLKAVIIIGLPLAKPDLETQELIEYYDLKFNKGWDYGYKYPAIIKSLQNAGRCIRSETDKGIIIFLDERYAWNNYLKCFPQDLNIKITKEPYTKIKEFLENN